MLSTRGEKSTRSSATSRYIGSSAAMHSSMVRSRSISSLLRTSIRKWGLTPLFGLDAGFLDGAAVAVHVGADCLREALGGAADRLVVLLRHLLAQLGRLQGLVHFGVEPRQHRRRHLARSHETEPQVELQVRVAQFLRRRIVGREAAALRAENGVAAQLAVLDLRHE